MRTDALGVGAAAGAAGGEPWWAGDVVVVVGMGLRGGRPRGAGVAENMDGMTARIVRPAGPGAWTVAVEGAGGEVEATISERELQMRERR
eukprot:521562-Prymnesium_polylepis.1